MWKWIIYIHKSKSKLLTTSSAKYSQPNITYLGFTSNSKSRFLSLCISLSFSLCLSPSFYIYLYLSILSKKDPLFSFKVFYSFQPLPLHANVPPPLFTSTTTFLTKNSYIYSYCILHTYTHHLLFNITPARV